MNDPNANFRLDQTAPIMVWIGGFAPIGGIETFTSDLCQAAARAGMKVDLLAWDRRSELLPAIRQAGVRVYCSPWRWGCRWGLPDWILAPLGFWKCRQASVVVFTKLVFTHRLQQIFHRFARRQGQRVIYVTPYRPTETWGEDVTRDPRRRKSVADLLSCFDLIVCQNETFAHDLRFLGYRGPMEMLPNLPPGGAENPAPYPAGPLTIGFLGRLAHQKNLPELLKVFALLLREPWPLPGPPRPFRLSIFGEGTLRAELENLARELGIESSVTFHGTVARAVVREAIQSCQLFCFTSHSEGQPIASLEILAEGRPIIATAVGAFSDMLVEPALGRTVPTGDTGAFLSAIKEMLVRQAGGEITPRDTVEAYRIRFDRDKTLRSYLQLLSLDSALSQPPTDLPELVSEP